MPRGKTQKSIDLIDACYAILQEIQPAGVRAVAYRLFVAERIESMAKTCTNRVSKQLVYAREQEIVPWEWIVDDTREADHVNAWKNPAAFVRTVRHSYRRDHWAYQPVRVQVVSEKNTVRGTLAPILNEYGVEFQPMHGYGSATKLHELAVEAQESPQQRLVKLYLGDWDPSGLHMSQIDAPQRLARYGGDAIQWRRIALTPTLIREYDLPGFDVETKHKDSRYHWYKTSQGARAWELDALNPNVLRAIVEAAIREYIQVEAWEQSRLAEQAETDSLQQILDRWTRRT